MNARSITWASKAKGVRDWHYIEVRLPADRAEDLAALLLDAGSGGVEERELDDGRVLLRAYFEALPDLAELRYYTGDLSIEAGTLPDEDWLRLWKQGFEPVLIGTRLLVSPSWLAPVLDESSDRRVVLIDPGMAFGTGTHATTRLCLDWLDANWRGGSLIDVGTGTGILAIAAALLAEGLVAACDVDPVAVQVARENAVANSVAERITFIEGGPAAVEGDYDVVVANLTADVICQLRTELARLLAPSGRLVVSGILLEQAADVAAALAAHGLASAWSAADGEWCAMEFARE
jgi:ribosomal protein L11 methyltransferase